ncbi:efflux RND transporter periplasmic adaptor subunit [Desulfofustis limnaeus]|uniref:MexE family multidrug efflux RND transporter periplasmic adaptor subunit n=1 Tax=Desulfofustis limnaeus TaxID=2740163 RepID=A0ABM7W5Y1_9BACT|nr:efflux RND transporter periplasmic adaptor subunit [Desulfofustis limnaeus]MDX9893948.1 efflux RND transporter periplasmic adaptor subunit [Desulfofustis sp.]BDD86337.1 MexE family multidrug efflux RND transporter periplasmic adaptor subunit [Desulfofustis limnaeus]
MNRHIRSAVFIAATAILMAIGGCKNEQQAARPAPPPPEVNVVTLHTQPVKLVAELPGRTAAFRIAEVRPQVSGIVQKRLFTEGSEVSAGELLYQIDPALYQANFDSAKAALAKAEVVEASARQKAERYRTLVRTKAVSEQDQIEVEAAWKQAVAEVAAAKAALEKARIDLDYTRVTAPISGRIGKSMISEGALVTAQQAMALAIIQQMDPIYVDLNQSSTDLLRLKKELAAGQITADQQLRSPVTVILDDGSLYGHEGYLEFSDVSVDQSTGTVTMRAIVDNPDQELLPGMFVRARIAKGTRPDGILVPAASVIRNSRGQATVLVVDGDNTVAGRIIEIEQNRGEQVLIASGLTAGERVVVAGIQKVKPGMPVTVAEAPVVDGQPATTAAKTE